MNAIDNISNDFGWVLPVLNSFASNPVWALTIGALISLGIWRSQTKLGDRLTLNVERRELYRAFIAQIEKATRNVDRNNWSHDPEIRRLWSLQAEVALLAGMEVTDRSAGVVSAINDYWNRGADQIVSRDGIKRRHFENVQFESRAVLKAMKEELQE